MNSHSNARPTAHEPTVSILVVSFNTREMTLECLRSIARETRRAEFEVLFIDNGSSDGTWPAVRSEFEDDARFVMVENDRNLGFAAANNVLGKLASGEFLLLLNPDTIVLDGAIDRILDFAAEHPGNGIWGGRTVFADGSLNPTSCWGPFSVWSEIAAAIGLRALFPTSTFFHPRGYGDWQRDSVREVGVVTGCFFLIRRLDWEHFSGFDPEFFMYGEETDLCMRAIEEGMRPIVTPDAVIVHHGSASESVELEKMIRMRDGQIRLFRRHFSWVNFQLIYQSMKMGVIVRAGFVSLKRRLGRGGPENIWAGLWQRRSEWTRGAKVPLASARTSGSGSDG